MTKTLVAIAVLTALASGCGSDEPQPVSAAPTAAPASEPDGGEHGFEPGHVRAVREYYGGDEVHAEEGDVEAEYHQPPRPATARLGEAITLTGSNIGVRMRVTVTGVADPARTSRPPRPGRRWVAVKIAMRSTGIAILEGQVGQGLLLHGSGGRARAVSGVRSSCSSGWHDTVRIDDSGPARGCLLFQLPRSARPRELRFALEQVPAEAGGRWSLR